MLLERETELEMLDGVLRDAAEGGRVVLIRGEAGVGKSSLVSEFLARHDEDASVLFGACDDLLTPQPLEPFWDMARTEPALFQSMQSGERAALLTALLDFLDRSLRPTVLVIEDTQWADAATLDVIKFIGRRITRTKGVAVLTYRDGEVDYDHPLRGVIGELPPDSLVRIHLSGLSKDAISKMAGTGDVDVGELERLTDGNPLFVNEILASGGDTVPLSLQDSVLARASKLSPGARQVLDILSVIPGGADSELLGHLLDPHDGALMECERQGLIETNREAVVFRHEVSRRALESALNSARRRDINQHVLTALGQVARNIDPARLLHHAREAGNVEAVIEHAPSAAWAAMAAGSLEEAVAHFQILEPHLDKLPKREQAVIYEAWARSESLLTFSVPRASSALDNAIALYRDLGEDRSLARTLLLAVRVYEMSQNPDKTDEMLDEALSIVDRLPRGLERAQAVSTRAWLAMMRGELRRGSELAAKAIELSEEADDESTLIHSLNSKGTIDFMLGDPRSREIMDDLRTRTRQNGNYWEEARVVSNLTNAALSVRQLSLARELAEEGLKLLKRHNVDQVENYFHAYRAEVMLEEGDWKSSEDIATEVLAIAPVGPTSLRFHLFRVVGRLDMRRGRSDHSSAFAEVWPMVSTSRQMQLWIPYASHMAEGMWISGDVDDESLATFQAVLVDALRYAHTWDAAELAFWLWKLERLETLPPGIADPYRLIMAGEPKEAARLWESMGYPYERALALAHGAVDSQIEAIEILETLGATAVAARIRQGLRASGVVIPRGRARETRQHPIGLTARQSEVLSLLSEELTNVEIADCLFLSPRTVEHHVSAVMGKLGVSTREEAVAQAFDQGLLTERLE